MILWFRTIKTILLINCLLIKAVLYTQATDSLNQAESRLRISGYIKDLQTLNFNKTFNNLEAVNLIHNRINLHYESSSKLSGRLELRNRMFWGEEVKITSNVLNSLKSPDEFLNMSITWIDNPGLVMLTNIDRLWLQYKNNNFETSLGRQRVNWGIGTIWNPNDIFNTYNFLDFDYEERPGRDALKMGYQLGEMSNIELAGATSKNMKYSVIAVKYFFNKSYYDFQFIGGLFNNTFTIGGGWSGIIGNAGFKGEIQYFVPHHEDEGLVNLTSEINYLFKNGWYLGGGLLFNSQGYDKPLENWESISFKLSPQYIMPTKWNTLLTTSKQFTPLFRGSLTTIFSPGTNLVILLPSLNYNIATNLDFDMVMQSFFAEEQGTFNGILHYVFFRGKWSF